MTTPEQTAVDRRVFVAKLIESIPEALVVSGLVSSLWMQPMMALTFGLVDLLLSPLSALVR